MRRASIPFVVVASLAFCAAAAVAYNSNPPVSRTGAPSEGTCHDCHGSYSLNQSGSIQLLDVPAYYRVGNTYRIRARISTSNTSGSSNRRWGFEVTAINSSDGTGAGTFANVAGEGTSIGTGSNTLASRSYVRQTDNKQTQSSPVEWAFDWTPPASGNIPVAFYAAGVAGNGSGSSGDWVYTTSASATDTTTDARSTTWGEVKSRYRR